MKKYIYVTIAVFLIFSHAWMYEQGKKAKTAEIREEYVKTIQNQQKAIENAEQKILDFQRIISYNNDECFNWVWPDEIIDAANPFLR